MNENETGMTFSLSHFPPLGVTFSLSIDIYVRPSCRRTAIMSSPKRDRENVIPYS